GPTKTRPAAFGVPVNWSTTLGRPPQKGGLFAPALSAALLFFPRFLGICPRTAARRNIALTKQKRSHHGGTVAVGHDQHGRSPIVRRRFARVSGIGSPAAAAHAPLPAARPVAP